MCFKCSVTEYPVKFFLQCIFCCFCWLRKQSKCVSNPSDPMDIIWTVYSVYIVQCAAKCVHCIVCSTVNTRHGTENREQSTGISLRFFTIFHPPSCLQLERIDQVLAPLAVQFGYYNAWIVYLVFLCFKTSHIVVLCSLLFLNVFFMLSQSPSPQKMLTKLHNSLTIHIMCVVW